MSDKQYPEDIREIEEALASWEFVSADKHSSLQALEEAFTPIRHNASKWLRSMIDQLAAERVATKEVLESLQRIDAKASSALESYQSLRAENERLRSALEEIENTWAVDQVYRSIAREALSSSIKGDTKTITQQQEQFALALSRTQLHRMLARHEGNPSLKEMLCAEADDSKGITEGGTE